MRSSDVPPARVPRALLLVLLFAALSGAPAVRAEKLALPLVLEEPSREGEVRVERGDGVLHLVFFATWCPPCLEEFPRLAELEARWGDRGYRLVLVAVPLRQSRERLAQLIANEEPPGRVGFDAAGSAQRACGVEDLPTHLLVDARGEVVLRSARLNEEVEQAVARLLERRR